MNQSRKTSVQGNGRQNDPYATQRHTMSQPPQNKNSRARLDLACCDYCRYYHFDNILYE